MCRGGRFSNHDDTSRFQYKDAHYTGSISRAGSVDLRGIRS
jgi:hypothetical protein